MIPALLITMSTRPRVRRAVSMIASPPSASPADLGCGDIRGFAARAVPGDRPAGVVDHDSRAARCEQQHALLAQASAGSADHRDLVVEPQVVVCHHVTGSSFMP